MNELTPYILAAALAWASGIRLYVVLFTVGLVHKFNWMAVPPELEILGHTWVLTATGLMLLTEFFADKLPAIDSIWDALHTFVRIPAGALLAAGIIAPQDGPAWALVAGLLGGTITAGTHFTKSGGRVLINTSPEPLSNWSASLLEDSLVIFGLWLAFTHPLIFALLLLFFLLLMAWLLPRLWRGIKKLMYKIAALNGAATTRIDARRP